FASAASALRVNVVDVKPGDEVRLSAFYRNGACAGSVWDPNIKGFVCKASSPVTRNARVGVFLPSGKWAGQTVLVVLYAENARPQRIADRVAIVSHTPIRLEFTLESARILIGYSGGKTA